MNVNGYKEIIKPLMGEYRYIHSVNVSEEAVKLAKFYGADREKAAIAGILHDITKEFSKNEQLQIMLDGGIILDNVQQNAPKLWHSISGSIYVKNILGIMDEDILNAIRFHTTGRAGMSLLEKVIYIADYTSKERDYNGVKTMRKKSLKSIESAMLYSYQFSFGDLTKRKLAIHPDQLECYNEIVLNLKGNNK